MKILMVANMNPNGGGISRVVNNLYDKLKKDKINVDIFNTKKNKFIRIFLIFPLILKTIKYDIVHVHGCSNLGFYPIIIGIITSKFILNKKVIITYHGGAAETFLYKNNKIIKWFLNKADCTTVMSLYLKTIFEKYNIKTKILKNLITLKINKKKQNNFSIPKIVSIRSISPIYNIKDIIEAYKIIKTKYNLATLDIAGTGDQVNYLKTECKQYKDIRFLGVLSNNKIQDLIRQNNIFISVPEYDNQPMSILEAFAQGTIVISTNVGGIKDMIINGKNGLLVDINNPNQIAETINWIISNPKLRKKIIIQGKKHVEKYLWKNIKQKLYNIYIN